MHPCNICLVLSFVLPFCFNLQNPHLYLVKAIFMRR
ncbi:hypothetical protein GLYMA_17G101451v4 [Glycine max]|nr:hypothetical protein GLYMA_17G101451v4 [Glycine max]KAH1117771.1 hypothetical protein GYH30_046841 [Glycine max]